MYNTASRTAKLCDHSGIVVLVHSDTQRQLVAVQLGALTYVGFSLCLPYKETSSGRSFTANLLSIMILRRRRWLRRKEKQGSIETDKAPQLTSKYMQNRYKI
jgi:hypothetical protein